MGKRKTPLVPHAQKALASLKAEIAAEQKPWGPPSAVEHFRELARAHVAQHTPH